MPFFAHSHRDHPSPGPEWQPLALHLVSVGAKARRFSAGSLPDEYVSLAEMAGLLHDLGKYRPEFQQMLCGLKPPREKTYHKQAGAAKAAIDLKCIPVAFAIAGHHGGLMCTRGLYVFEHESQLGSAPAHELFDRVMVDPLGADAAPRSFAEYKDRIRVDTEGLPSSIKLHRMVG